MRRGLCIFARAAAAGGTAPGVPAAPAARENAGAEDPPESAFAVRKAASGSRTARIWRASGALEFCRFLHGMIPRWIAGGNGPAAPVPGPAWSSAYTGKRVSELRIPGSGRGHVLPPRKGSRGVRTRFRVGSRRRNRFETLQIRLGKCAFTPRAVRSEHGRVWRRSFVRAPIGFRGRRCRGLRSELPRPQARCRCRAFHRRVRIRSPQPRSCG